MAGICPLLSCDQPLFVYANVAYEMPSPLRNKPLAPGQEDSETFAISSRVLSAAPAQLQAAGVKATDKPERMIDDGARGWHDWYRLNWGHAPSGSPRRENSRPEMARPGRRQACF